jgi:hypothetical protein
MLGVGIRGLASGTDAIPWHDVEIQRDVAGKPSIVLHRYAATIAAAQGLSSFDISISHDGDYAIASARWLLGQRLIDKGHRLVKRFFVWHMSGIGDDGELGVGHCINAVSSVLTANTGSLSPHIKNTGQVIVL